MATIGTSMGNAFGTAMQSIAQLRQQQPQQNPQGFSVMGPSTYTSVGGSGSGTGFGVPNIDQRYQTNYGTSPMQMGQTLYNQWSNSLGAAPNVQELPQQFYDAAKKNAVNDLQNMFFNPGGVYDSSMANESAAGRLGSGVGLRMLQQTVTQPLMQQTTAINNNVMQAQLQNHQQTAQMNAQFQAQRADLAARAAQADAGTLSQEQLAQLDADLRAYETQIQAGSSAAQTQEQLLAAQMQQQTEQQKNALQYLQIPMSYSPEQSGVASTLNNQFGGGPLPGGSPMPTQSWNTSAANMSPGNVQYPSITPGGMINYNQGPQGSGAYYGQVKPDNTGRSWTWWGPQQGWRPS